MKDIKLAKQSQSNSKMIKNPIQANNPQATGQVKGTNQSQTQDPQLKPQNLNDSNQTNTKSTATNIPTNSNTNLQNNSTSQNTFSDPLFDDFSSGSDFGNTPFAPGPFNTPSFNPGAPGLNSFGTNYNSGYNAPQQPKRLTPEERVEMIEKVFQEVLSRKPDTRDINYYKYSTLDEDQIKKQLINSTEHKDLLTKGREYEQLKTTADQAQTKSRMLEGKIQDQIEEFRQLNILMQEKNRYIVKLRNDIKALTLSSQSKSKVFVPRQQMIFENTGTETSAKNQSSNINPNLNSSSNPNQNLSQNQNSNTNANPDPSTNPVTSTNPIINPNEAYDQTLAPQPPEISKMPMQETTQTEPFQPTMKSITSQEAVQSSVQEMNQTNTFEPNTAPISEISQPTNISTQTPEQDSQNTPNLPASLDANPSQSPTDPTDPTVIPPDPVQYPEDFQNQNSQTAVQQEQFTDEIGPQQPEQTNTNKNPIAKALANLFSKSSS
ncbi:hypothetical protein JW887_06000 [Candidatus Dojkabacteria bacterium]|nr:hypothetical protein [Candidatus Dojkabacteria bacterium]